MKNECDLFLIDIRLPESRSGEYSYIHRLNVINGDYLKPIVLRGKYIDDIINEIIQAIIYQEPTKVIFDRAGYGQYFYTIFMTYIQNINYKRIFEIDCFGTVIYKHAINT